VFAEDTWELAEEEALCKDAQEGIDKCQIKNGGRKATRKENGGADLGQPPVPLRLGTGNRGYRLRFVKANHALLIRHLRKLSCACVFGGFVAATPAFAAGQVADSLIQCPPGSWVRTASSASLESTRPEHLRSEVCLPE